MESEGRMMVVCNWGRGSLQSEKAIGKLTCSLRRAVKVKVKAAAT
jgi:hypothetical protein